MVIVDIYKCYLLYYQKDFLGILQSANIIEKNTKHQPRKKRLL